MPVTTSYLETAAQDIGDRADTLRINDTDDFAVTSSIRTGVNISVKIRPNNYVNNNIANIKLLDGTNVISEKVVDTSIDTTVDIGEFEFLFNLERGV